MDVVSRKNFFGVEIEETERKSQRPRGADKKKSGCDRRGKRESTLT
jgi:hypothetical protein